MVHLVVAIPGEIPRKYAVPESFTYRELQTMKNITGLRPLEFEAALGQGDAEVVIALAVICATRAGHKISVDDLLDLEIGSIRIEEEEEAQNPTNDGTNDSEVPTQTTQEDGGTPAFSVSTD